MAKNPNGDICTIERVAERYPDVAAQLELYWASLKDGNEFDYMDGVPRVAVWRDWGAVEAYAWEAEHNCCGSMDDILELTHYYRFENTTPVQEGSVAIKVMFGFNYGH